MTQKHSHLSVAKDLDDDLNSISEIDCTPDELPDFEPESLPAMRRATADLAYRLITADWPIRALVFPGENKMVQTVTVGEFPPLVTVLCTRTIVRRGRKLVVNAAVDGILARQCRGFWARREKAEMHGLRRAIVLPHREGAVIEIFAHYAGEQGRIAEGFFEIGELTAFRIDADEYHGLLRQRRAGIL